MQIQNKELDNGVKLFVEKEGKEVARAYLYVLNNDLHDQPFGFMEDVYVSEELRGQGVGSQLVNTVIAEAEQRGCYKLVCTSRYAKEGVHKLYEKLGFSDHGKEFRVDF